MFRIVSSNLSVAYNALYDIEAEGLQPNDAARFHEETSEYRGALRKLLGTTLNDPVLLEELFALTGKAEVLPASSGKYKIHPELIHKATISYVASDMAFLLGALYLIRKEDALIFNSEMTEVYRGCNVGNILETASIISSKGLFSMISYERKTVNNVKSLSQRLTCVAKVYRDMSKREAG